MAKKRIVDEEMRFNLVVNSNEAQKKLYDLEKDLRDLKDEGKALRAERAKLGKQTDKNREEYKRLSKAIKENKDAVTLATQKFEEHRNSMGLNAQSMASLQRRARELSLQIRHMTPGSPDRLKLQEELKRIKNRIDELRGSAIATEGSLSKLAGGFNKYAALGASVIASLTGVVLTMQKVIDYNGKLSDSLADVRKTTGLTVDEVDELNKSFGAFNTRTSRMELLKLAEDAGRLGITGVENLRAYTEQANKLRVALKDDLSETQIMEIGKMVNIYKVGEATAKDFAGSMDALGSAINEVSYSGANQAGYLVEYLKRQAGVASQTRISAADNVGYAATFDEIGQSVEVSATMMNKVFIDMFENTSEYAKIAGMDMREFSELLATDANEAMLRFLEGLNGNNEGLGVMVQKMEKLQAGGTRGVQALAALASSTATIRSRQETANKALQEATSLTDEYNIKNNNLAAVLEKVNRRIHAFMAGEGLTGLLTALVTGFGKLIGAVKDLDKELDRSIKKTHESAKANRALAMEGDRLLKRYEELTRDGVEPSTEAKMELDEITLKLKDSFGDSVVEINKETGALMLNTEKVREQIKAKRLAADEEAATNASRLIGVREEKEAVAERIKIAANEYTTRKQIFDARNAQDIEAIKNSKSLTAAEKQRQMEMLEGYKELDKARIIYQAADTDMAKLVKREKELIAGLKELHYTADDAIKALVGDMPNMDEIIIPEVTPPKSDGNREKLLDQLKKDILKATQSAEDARIALLNDSYLEELLNMQMAHQRKMDALQEQLMDEAEIMRQPLEFRKLYRERNAAVNKQIEEDTKLHGLRAATLVQKGIQQQLKEQEDLYNREKTLREQKYAQELLAYSGHKELQEELRKKHQEEELAEQAKYLEEQIRQFKLILEQGDFGGFDLDLLNEEQKVEIESMLEDLKLKLLEVKQAKDALGGAESDGLDLGAAGDIDIFGFTAQDWVDTLENIETMEEGIEAAAMAVQGLMNAWSQYNRFVTENENKRFKEFEKNNNEKKKRLKDRLDSGVLNQRQYDKALTELEEKADKEKAELEYKQAKRAWEMQLIQSIANTALGITQALSSSPPPASFILAGIVGAMGMIQQGLLRKNKPVKGFEEGLIPDEWLFPVEREQDGKIFNARYGGQRISGLVNEPTLVGERPELVISNPDLKKFDPAITRSVMNEIRRVKGYEVGYIGPTAAASVEQNPQPQADYGLSPELAMEMIGLLRELRDQGIMAYLVRDMENTKKLQDDLERLKKYKEKARL